VSQKLAIVIVGLAFSSLAARAETNLQRLRRLGIRPLYPTLTQPPSTRIKDGLWKEENEYGLVRYTNGEKLTNEKILSARQAAAQSDSPKAEDVAVPVSSGSIAQTDKPAAESLKTAGSWKKSLAPGTSAMTWNRMDRPSSHVALNRRPFPDSSIREAGNPENLGQAPDLPPRETTSAGTASIQLPPRTTPDASVRGNPGSPEQLPHTPDFPSHETAIASVDYAALSARLAPDLSLRDSVKSPVQQLPSPPPLPKHETKPETADIKIPDERFTTRSLPDLIDLLRNGPSPRFRARIADELGRRGLEAEQAVPALSEALNDASSLVRASAALAIGNIGGGDSVGLQARLTALLQDKNPDVKMSAETALSRLGK
jgi:hypothetical protein